MLSRNCYFIRPIGLHNERLIIAVGDLSKIKCDVCVNAARPTLLGGGGVDGAIHHAAGPKLLEECKTLNGCETGNAKITKEYNMYVKNIIHAVGPKWHGGNRNEEELLRSAYINSFNIAIDNNLKTIAFPAISCGNYGFPMDKGVVIFLKIAKEYLEKYKDLTVIFAVNNIVFKEVLNQIEKNPM
jgi:O-acetyl-ADP-ribose deacetylase (regulator of RNase III)